MDRIFFGDNQFFGVNHISDDKARQTAIKFRDNMSIIDLLDYTQEIGILKFVCSTRPRIAEICDYFRDNPERYSKLELCPMIPDIHKYNNELTELGIHGVLKRYMPSNIFTLLFKGGLALAKQDYQLIIELLIDAEMKMFKGLNTKIIFLQNNITDLLLGLKIKDIFINIVNYIEEKYSAEVGFMTMNLLQLLDFLEECNIKNPIVCASINKIGFRMSGGTSTYERIKDNKQFRCIAMQVLAAGAIPPQEAVEYVSSLKWVDSILFGASTKYHISQTKNLIENYFS